MAGDNKNTHQCNRNSQKGSVSVFKQVFSRHKRKGNDPNRIDDLFLGDGVGAQTSASTGPYGSEAHGTVPPQVGAQNVTAPRPSPEAEGVIDVVRIRVFQAHNKGRKRKRVDSSLPAVCSDEDKDADANTNTDADADADEDKVIPYCCFGHDLVFPVQATAHTPLGDSDEYQTTRTDTATLGYNGVTASNSMKELDRDNNNLSSTPRILLSGYGFHEFPGVYLYPGALGKDLCLELAHKAVTEYCERPVGTSSNCNTSTNSSNCNSENHNTSCHHRTNIDLLPPKPEERINHQRQTSTGDNGIDERMWTLWKEELRDKPLVRETKNQARLLQKIREASKQTPPIPEGNGNSGGGRPIETKAKANVKKCEGNKKSGSNHPKHKFYRRFAKLSWATMGYHYDWTERSYHPQKKSFVPELVARVSTLFATAQPSPASGGEPTGSTDSSNINSIHRGKSDRAVGGVESSALQAATAGAGASKSSFSFTPSASIVNYYTTKSTMGGHRDDLEDPGAMDKPIISISLGLPGIFVIGGPSKDECTTPFDKDNEASPEKERTAGSPTKTDGKAGDGERVGHGAPSGNARPLLPPASPAPHPVRAVLLRQGDVLVMGGPSRLNYHAMARVLPHAAAAAYEQRGIGATERQPHAGTAEHNHNYNNAQGNGEEQDQHWRLPRTGAGSGGNGISRQDLGLQAVCQHWIQTASTTCTDGMTGAPSPARSKPAWIQGGEDYFLNEYLKLHRININVRQVYPDGIEEGKPMETGSC